MDENEGKLRRQAKQRVEARMGLLIHLGMYAAVNAGLVLTWWLTKASYPWFVWPLLGWGAGIIGHLLAYFFGPGSPGEQRAIERELRRVHFRGV
jgi:hypothetical protein